MRNLKKKLTKANIVFITIFLVLALQPRFSCKYKSIPRANILNELVESISSITRKTEYLQNCDYDIIYDTSFYGTSWKNHIPIAAEDELKSGEYVPNDCKPLYSTAILVPYRDRKSQLDIFVPYMHNFLKKQKIHYRIFVIEQAGTAPWNKGKLFNAGAQVAMELDFPCLILHDVDLLPLNPANIYACTSQPRHMSANIDKFRYNLPYDFLIGGALAMQTKQFIQINGYSNKFENWGGEDDELYNRIKHENLTITRFPPDISRYTMLVHAQAPINNKRFLQVKENFGKYKNDGLNNVSFKKKIINHHSLYTNITIEI